MRESTIVCVVALHALHTVAPAYAAPPSADEPAARARSSAPSTRPTTPRAWTPGLGLIVTSGVLAASGLGLGIGFTAVANGHAADMTALHAKLGNNTWACFSGATPDCRSLHEAVVGRRSFTTAAVASFVGGGVFAVTTAALAARAAAPSKPSTLRAAPIVGVGMGGVLLSGAW